MAGTSTKTHTSTFTRCDVLAFQIKYVIKATTGGDFEKIVQNGIINNQWVDVIDIYAVDKKEFIHANIRMSIDWDKHQMHINLGRSHINIDKTLPDGEQLHFAVGEIVSFFNKRVKNAGFSTEWTLSYRNGIDIEEARKVCGTSPIKKKKAWAKGEVHKVLKETAEKADEFTIELSMLVDEFGKNSRESI